MVIEEATTSANFAQKKFSTDGKIKKRRNQSVIIHRIIPKHAAFLSKRKQLSKKSMKNKII